MRIKRILAMLMAMVLVLTSINMTAIAASEPTITMGAATYSDADLAMYFPNLTVSGDNIRTIMISFSENVTSGDQMILPALSGSFTVSPTSNDYVKRINVNEGVLASEIQALLRGIGFRVAGQSQTVNITVTSELITADTFYNQSTGHYYQFVPSTTTSWTNAYLHAKSLSYMGRNGYLATVTSKEEDVFLNTLSGGKTGWLGGTILANSGTKVDALNGSSGSLLYYSAMNEQAVVSTGWYWACGPEIGNTFFTANSLRASTGETADAMDAKSADDQNPSTYYNWARGTSSYEPNNVTDGILYTSDDYETCLTTLTVAGNIGKQGTTFSWNDKNYGTLGIGVWNPKGYFIEYGNQTLGDVGSDSSAYASDSGSLSGVPVLTNGSVRRISNTEATIRFSTDRGGSYYYAIVEDGASQPFIDTTGAGVVCQSGAQTLTNPAGLTEGAKDIYIQLKDGMGKFSEPLKLDLAPANNVLLTTLHWLTPTTYHCDLELSSSAKMITISVDSGYFTIPSLGAGLSFLGGTKGSTYLNTYSSSTQQFDSVIFSFADADAVESILSSIVYVTQGDTPQSIHASASTILPMGDDIFFNGHFYRYVSSSIDWMSAALAAGGTVDPYFEGRGYLATATNQSENSILLKLTDNGGFGADHWNDAWLGGLWQRNSGTVDAPSIDRGTDEHEITFQDLQGATDTQRHNMLLDYSERFGSGDGNIYEISNTVKYYWLDGPEAGQEIAYNTPTFSPWHGGEPNSGDFIYIGWEGAYWDDLSWNVNDYNSVYNKLSGYVVEFSGYDGGSDAGIIKEATKTVTADMVAPELTAGVSDRTSHTEGSFHFTATEAGQYYYAIVEQGGATPSINTANDGIACVTGDNIIINPVGLTKGAKDLYIRMKDSVGNLSNVVKINVGFFNTAPSFLLTSSNIVVSSNSMDNDLTPYLHVSDPDENQQMIWGISSPPAHGVVHCMNTLLFSGGNDIAPEGDMIYTPVPGYCGEDTFTLAVSDGIEWTYKVFHVTVEDQTKPTVTITQGTNHWNSFLNTITFGLFFKNTIDISLTAQDQGGSGLKSVQYYRSTSPLSLAELQNVTDWNAYTSAFQITPVDKQKNIIYAKATDNAGNVTVVSSDGMEFDLQNPTIQTNYQKGASTMEVTVTDDGSKIDTVVYSINEGSDIEATLVNGKFTTPSLADGKYDIVITATDKVGNSTTETIPVVSLHSVKFYQFASDPLGPIKTETVEYGDAATAPTNMERVGFSFNGWDQTFTSVTTDLVVNGTWEIDGITVLPYTGIYDGLGHLCASVTGMLPEDMIRYSTNGVDYSATCPTVTNYGTYPVYVSVERTGYTPWVSTLKQAVVHKKELAASMIEVPVSYKYTGQPIRPVPVLTDGLKTLQEDTDYTVEYSNNTDIGIATISVTGIGNYKDTVTKSFAIYANNTTVNIVDEKTPQVLAEGLEKLYEDNQIYTSTDREVEENGGLVNIELSVQTKTSTGADQGKITQMAVGKEIGLFLDISLFKTVKLAGETNGTTSPIKHTNQLLSIVIPIPNDLKNKEGITLYRVHEGVPSLIPVGAANAVDGEYCTIDSQNITLYVQNFSTYAIGYNQIKAVPTSPQTGESTTHIPVVVWGIVAIVAIGVVMKRKKKNAS